MKRIIKSVVLICLIGIIAGKITLSAFTSNGQVQGNYFSTGHADLQLLKDVSQPPTPENLAQAVPGSNFSDIIPGWQQRIAIKLLNTGSLQLQTVLAARNLLDSPMPDIKDVISVRVHQWHDDGDGIIEAVELGSTTETKTLSSWLSTPFTLGMIPPNHSVGYAIEFELGDIDDAYQNATAALDLVFDAVATQ